MSLETMTKLQTVTLTDSQSSIDFTNIPQGYTDLCLMVSVRGTNTTLDNLSMQYNGDTSSSYKYTELIGTGASASGGQGTATSHNTLLLGSSSTASTFTNHKFYIYNYSKNVAKNTTTEVAVENNAASTLTQMRFQSWRWDNPSPITSIKLFNSTYSFVQYSTATLYGIKNARQTAGNSIKATGGNIVFDGTYVTHTFTSTDSFIPTQSIFVDYLVIAGGGSGGGDRGGGGGAGGYRTANSFSVTPGSSITVTVGAGGAGTTSVGNKGSNSVFSTISSTGGGAGWTNAGTAGAGGSGGGGWGASGAASNDGGAGNQGGYSPVEGYAGGNGEDGDPRRGGGGGGASEAGNTDGQAQGGDGTSSSITGSDVIRAGGGGGGAVSGAGGGGDGGGGAGSNTGSGTAGTANTGGGGGGAGDSGVSRSGGNGGSGIVIIRYKG